MIITAQLFLFQNRHSDVFVECKAFPAVLSAMTNHVSKIICFFFLCVNARCTLRENKNGEILLQRSLSSKYFHSFFTELKKMCFFKKVPKNRTSRMVTLSKTILFVELFLNINLHLLNPILQIRTHK